MKRRRWRAPVGPQIKAQTAAAARRPNAVWAVDFKGGFTTADGRIVHTLTITDVYSHYILALDTVRALSTAEVKARMKVIFRRYGLPGAIRTDHGTPFYGPGSRGWTQLSVWWVRLGIRVEFIGRNGNAAHEQMHRILKARITKPAARNAAAQRARFAWWRRYYNHQRPHQGAGGMPPGLRYRPSTKLLPASMSSLPYAPTWEVLTVNPYGYVYWHNKKRSIGRAFAGERIGLRRINHQIAVYLGPHLIGTLQPDEPAIRPLSNQAGRLTASPVTPPLKSERGRGCAPSPAPHPKFTSAQSTNPRASKNLRSDGA